MTDYLGEDTNLPNIGCSQNGKPTRLANLPSDTKVNYPESLPVTEGINQRCCYIPRLIRYKPDIIEEHANAYKKVAANYRDLLDGDTDTDIVAGGLSSFFK